MALYIQRHIAKLEGNNNHIDGLCSFVSLLAESCKKIRVLSNMDTVTSKFPNFDEYCSTYQNQSFSLPNSVIYYILKNPKSSKSYKKLTKVCKYFFIKNPLLVLHCLKFTKDGWKTCSNDEKCDKERCKKSIELNKISASKLWITFQLIIERYDGYVASKLIQKLGKPPSFRLELYEQTISFDDFKILSSRIKNCKLTKTIIKSNSEEEIPVEIIIANIPNIKALFYEASKNSKSISSKTAKEILKIPSLKNLKHLRLSNAQENFDLDTFFNEIVKKSETRIKCALEYLDPISDEFRHKLQKIVDEILVDNGQTYHPPWIYFPGQARSEDLCNLLCRFAFS